MVKSADSADLGFLARPIALQSVACESLETVEDRKNKESEPWFFFVCARTPERWTWMESVQEMPCYKAVGGQMEYKGQAWLEDLSTITMNR